MRTSSTLSLAVVVLAVAPALPLLPASETVCPIVPVPKSSRDHGKGWRRASADQCVSVVGAKATEPERYAAGRLQGHIQHRHKRTLPIVGEGQVPAAAKQLVLCGQRSTHALLDQLCARHKIDLSDGSPGHDGFVIECVEDAGRQVVVVGGSNARGVLYGLEALFDLMRAEGPEVVMPAVSVRDWPSIAWRGRPHSVLHHHLVPGAMDAYVRARINFTDVRDDPAVKAGLFLPARKASMGFPAGVPVDRGPVKRVIDEAHRRGMFVYGTVSCGVDEARFPGVIRTFEELLELGVDGLWLSFDDTGAGANPTEIIRLGLELGRRHGMTDRRIAITPPSGSYQFIDRPFNATCAKVPGMEQAQWLFTRVPCQADAQTARAQGIQRLPGWWHNLVGIRGGFLHNDNVVCTLRADDRPAYLDMQPLSRGWRRPEYEQRRKAEKCTDCVLLWGVVNGWPEEYEVGALGLWAWNPAGHDWDQVRRSVYGYVYGPAQVQAAWDFDERFAELKSLFDLPAHRFEPNKGFPGRLKKLDDRPRALAAIDDLEGLARRLCERSPQETAIDPARLQSVYLEPMRTTLVYARKMALLDYPEHTQADLEQRMIRLVEAGDLQTAKKTLDEVRPKVEQQLARIASELDGLKGLDKYLEFWRQRVADVAAWQALAKDRSAKARVRLDDLLKGDPAVLFPYKQATAEDLPALFARISEPPPGKVLEETAARAWFKHGSQSQGAFAVGWYHLYGTPFVAIGYPPKAPSTVGDFGEVSLEMPAPRFQGRLLADFFVTDTRLDNRWRGYRFMQLWAGGQKVWEADIAADQTGHEWVTVDLTEAAKAGRPIELRFRVTDQKPVSTHASVTFLGPLRLREAK